MGGHDGGKRNGRKRKELEVLFMTFGRRIASIIFFLPIPMYAKGTRKQFRRLAKATPISGHINSLSHPPIVNSQSKLIGCHVPRSLATHA